MLEGLKFTGVADAHTRRITLNLIRASTICPDDVALIVDQLADDGWDWSKLSAADAEAIYGLVTEELVEAAKAEFAADTRTAIDLDRHRGNAPEFIDDDGDTHCPLCGHKHLRWGFTLRNTEKRIKSAEEGHDLLVGSSCVVQYGLRVDAEQTAEAALAALNAAIARLTRAAECEDWQAEHPDHAAELAIVARAESYVGKEWRNNVPYYARQRLPQNWGLWWSEDHRDFARWAKATVKHYAKNGYLTAPRTAQLYESGALATAQAIVAQVERALAESPVFVYWQEWLERHPLISPQERALVQECLNRGWLRHQLYESREAVIAACERRHTQLPPPPTFGSSPPSLREGASAAAKSLAARTEAAVVVYRDDTSDLPGMY